MVVTWRRVLTVVLLAVSLGSCAYDDARAAALRGAMTPDRVTVGMGRGKIHDVRSGDDVATGTKYIEVGFPVGGRILTGEAFKLGMVSLLGWMRDLYDQAEALEAREVERDSVLLDISASLSRLVDLAEAAAPQVIPDHPHDDEGWGAAILRWFKEATASELVGAGVMALLACIGLSFVPWAKLPFIGKGKD